MGRPRYSVERLEIGHEYGDPVEEAFFVDSGVTVKGSRMISVSGLRHLEGHRVSILADGRVHPPRIVTRGAVTLSAPADTVQVGLPYASVLTTLNLEAQIPGGSPAMLPKRFTRAALRLIESGGGAAGPDEDNIQDLIYEAGKGAAGEAPALFTGDSIINWPGGYEREGGLTVKQNDPLPFTLAAIIPEMIM
jgi:hypothetical protein